MSQRKDQAVNEHNTHSLKAPLNGVVYFSPIPGAKPYVEIGQSVKAGQTVCLIEAMKMFVEIKASRDGIVSARHLDDGAIIDSTDLLFTVEEPHPKATTLFDLIDEIGQRKSMSAEHDSLSKSLIKLKAHLAVKPLPEFEECADKLYSAVFAVFNQKENINETLNELDAVWSQYWNQQVYSYNHDLELKKIMVSIFAVLGTIAGIIVGTACALMVFPASGAVGAIGGAIIGAGTGAKIADCCFFNSSKNKLDSAVQLSGKLNEIKQDIGMVAALKPL